MNRQNYCEIKKLLTGDDDFIVTDDLPEELGPLEGPVSRTGLARIILSTCIGSGCTDPLCEELMNYGIYATVDHVAEIPAIIYLGFAESTLGEHVMMRLHQMALDGKITTNDGSKHPNNIYYKVVSIVMNLVLQNNIKKSITADIVDSENSETLQGRDVDFMDLSLYMDGEMKITPESILAMLEEAVAHGSRDIKSILYKGGYEIPANQLTDNEVKNLYDHLIIEYHLANNGN